MKKQNQKLINDVLTDEPHIIRPNIKYTYKKNDIEVVFIDNSEYHEYFIDQNITNKYIFDDKGKKHLLIAQKANYEKYNNIYSEVVIKSTLRLFVNRRKTQRKFKSLFISLTVFTLIANIIILANNEFKKIFFVPLISVIIILILFIYTSKLINELYLKDKQRTKEQLFIALPNLQEELKLDVR